MKLTTRRLKFYMDSQFKNPTFPFLVNSKEYIWVNLAFCLALSIRTLWVRGPPELWSVNPKHVHFLTPNGLEICSQFHQHCTCTFFVRKCFKQLFSSYILALQFFCAKILAQNACVKCWWNWHVIDKKLLLKVNVRELRVDQNYFFSNKMSLNRFVLIQTRQKKTVVTEPLRHRVIIFNGFFNFFNIIIRKLIQN